MTKYFKKIKTGDSFKERFSYSQEDVDIFAEVSGDKNPIHIDQEFASKSIFGKRIIHGFLGASIFSKIFAMSFPGEGTIYLKQDLKFIRPMFVNIEYTAKVEVIKCILEKNRAVIKTEIYDSNNQLVVSGEALIQNKHYL